MTHIKAVVVSIVLISSYAYAQDVYSCNRVATKEDGGHRVQMDSHGNFPLTGDQVKVKLTRPKDDADKSLTYRRCFKVKQDQSNFSKWFELECRGMESFDGTVITTKKSIVGAYAGFSRELPPHNPCGTGWLQQARKSACLAQIKLSCFSPWNACPSTN